MPILNRFLFEVDEKTAQKAFIILFVLFSCMEFLQDTFRTGAGYSALWLMVLYCMGALAKRIHIFENKKTISLLLMWAFCIVVTWWAKIYIGIGDLVNYVSPTIVMSGLLMVVLFARIPLKGSIISKISPLAFGIYLFQLSPILWNYLAGAFSFVGQFHVIVSIVCTFGLAALIFVSGLLVEFIRYYIAKAIGIPKLSKKLVSLANRLLEKMLFILE